MSPRLNANPNDSAGRRARCDMRALHTLDLLGCPVTDDGVAIAEAEDTGDSLAEKVARIMALPAGASLELYLSSDGTPIEAGATLAAQGVRDGAALDVVVSYPKVCVHRLICMRAHH